MNVFTRGLFSSYLLLKRLPMKRALDVKTARAYVAAIDADGFSQATCELLGAGVQEVRG